MGFRNHHTARQCIGYLAAAVCLALFAAVCALGDSGAAARHTTRDHVDCIELNHVVDVTGKVQLEQVIFWDRTRDHSQFVVRAWRSLKSPSQLPYRVGGAGQSGGHFRADFHDARDGNIQRSVTAHSAVETWTDFDPETVNQDVLGRHLRADLTLPRARRVAAGSGSSR